MPPTFDYRVVAKRVGYEDVRMEKVDSLQDVLEQEIREEGRRTEGEKSNGPAS